MTLSRRGNRILVVDDEEKIRNILAAVLRDEGYQVEVAGDGIEAVDRSAKFKPHLLIVDLRMPGMDGIETIGRIKDRLPNAVAVILTAHGTIESAVQAIKRGAYDYLTKPFDNEQMLLVVKRALDLVRLTEEVDQLKAALHKRYGLDSIIGESPVMHEVTRQIREIAATDATVLIEGESGTGKELAAKAIHYESKRKSNPLVVVDCTAIPATLIESEFFGHEKGAFTDARRQRTGKFQEADTGTIFLDEVSELPTEAQAKLLRVLQEKEFIRVGGNLPVKVDVRVIAATNRSLEKQVRDGRFREDLYYRLNVLKVCLPPLREHVEDIPLYVRHFLAKHRDTFGRNITDISGGALQMLEAYDWRGNVRELENVVQRAMLRAKGDRIEVSDIEFPNAGAKRSTSIKTVAEAADGLEAYVRSLTEQAERQFILQVLEQTRWNRTAAAAKLKISRKTLFNKMRRYKLQHL